jgi:hypothetical protein
MGRYCDHGREAATCLLCRRDRDQEREELINASPEVARLRAALAEDEVEITALTRERDEARIDRGPDHKPCCYLHTGREADALRALVGQLVEALRSAQVHLPQSGDDTARQARDALAAAAKVKP